MRVACSNLLVGTVLAQSRSDPIEVGFYILVNGAKSILNNGKANPTVKDTSITTLSNVRIMKSSFFVQINASNAKPLTSKPVCRFCLEKYNRVGIVSILKQIMELSYSSRNFLHKQKFDIFIKNVNLILPKMSSSTRFAQFFKRGQHTSRYTPNKQKRPQALATIKPCDI